MLWYDWNLKASYCYNIMHVISRKKFSSFSKICKKKENALGNENMHPLKMDKRLYLAINFCQMQYKMKYFKLFALLALPILLCGQTLDSSFTRQIDSLILVSRSLTGQQEFEKALETGNLAEKIALERFDSSSVPYANCSFNRGRVLHMMGDPVQAEFWYLKAKDIREKLLGKDHSDYRTCLMNLGIVYYEMGMFNKAEIYFQELKGTLEKLQLNASLEYANVMNNLGSIYNQVGQYESSENYFNQGKSIIERTFGRDHPNFVRLLINIAALYHATGKYEMAEQLYLEVMAIFQKTNKGEDLELAALKYNLGSLYQLMGQFQRSENYYLAAIEITEKMLGKEQLQYAGYIQGLATMYINMGQYENKLDPLYKAEPLLKESQRIVEKIMGKENQNYAQCLNSLAILYNCMKQYQRAEPLYLEAKSIQEKVLGKEHPDYAASLHNLASLYLDMNQSERGEPLILEAIAIREKVQGKEHPEYLQGLHELATTYSNMSKFEKAEPIYLEESKTLRKLIQRASHYLSEREMLSYVLKFSINQDQIASFIQKSHSMRLVPDYYDNSLFYKGFLLNAASQMKNLATKDSITVEKFDRLKVLHRQLAAEYAKALEERSPELEIKLRDSVNTIEKELARSIEDYGQAIREVSWKDVQKKLKSGECAIEFVHFRKYEESAHEHIYYAALVLKFGQSEPALISLFEETQLDSLFKNSGVRGADYVNHLYTLADRGAQALEHPRRSLYELIWKPLEKELMDVKKVYYSPTGLLHRLNLGAIPIQEDQTFSDRYQCIALNSTRQLAVENPRQYQKNEAVLYGGLQYDADSLVMKEGQMLASRSRGELSFNMTDSTLRGGSWNYLAGTDKEVNAIARIMKASGREVKLITGNEGTEESFKKLTVAGLSPRLVHVATHGYFFPDPKEVSDGQQLSISSRESVFKISDHPMLRSGLILSGGNAGWKGERTLVNEEDGVLTAYEISQMDLRNTELVVLSACETGLGDIQGNEGVYGLQRAFKIAGVKYIIMSLWQVPDKQTGMLMTTFYKKWLEAEGPDKGEKKMNIPDAFHAAQKELRDIGLDPYQWAGFVLIE